MIGVMGDAEEVNALKAALEADVGSNAAAAKWMAWMGG